MKRQLDGKSIRKWKDRVGGIDNATRLISDELECSISKAEKVATGSYPSQLSSAEQKALAKLLNLDRDVLFPIVRAKGKRAS